MNFQPITGSPSSTEPEVEISVESNLDAIGQERWNALWARSEAPSVFARFEWAKAWWRSFGSGRELRLYTARINGELAGLLPTSWPAEHGGASSAVVLVGDEHADYAGILSAHGSGRVLQALLEAVSREIPAAGNLLLRDIRSDTRCARKLERHSSRFVSRWLLVSTTPCPRASLGPDRLKILLNKDSLRRHSKKLHRLGQVGVQHFEQAADILPRLAAFFEQHIARWSDSEWPSLFLKQSNRIFYSRLVDELSGTGQLVFTELSLDGAPAAFHFGFVSEGDLLWYKPSFNPQLARYSPGEVLLRELLLFAEKRGLSGIDFTRGNEAFKRRFSDVERYTETFRFCANRSEALRSRGQRVLRHHMRAFATTRSGSALRRWLETIRR